MRAANERPEPAAERLVPAPVMGVALLLRGRALVDESRGSTPATLRSEGRKLRRGLAGPVDGGGPHSSVGAMLLPTSVTRVWVMSESHGDVVVACGIQ